MKNFLYVSWLLVCSSLCSSYYEVGPDVKKQGFVLRSFQGVDRRLNRVYSAATDNNFTKLFSPTDGCAKLTLNVCTGLIGTAILAKGVNVAYAHKDSLAPLLTMNNAVNTAGCIYMANKLAPDWAKGFFRRVPVAKRVVFQKNLRETVVPCLGHNCMPCQSPSLACAEYLAMGCMAYALQNHINIPNIAKVALACECIRVVTPAWIKALAINMPIVRRLIV